MVPVRTLDRLQRVRPRLLGEYLIEQGDLLVDNLFDVPRTQ